MREIGRNADFLLHTNCRKSNTRGMNTRRKLHTRENATEYLRAFMPLSFRAVENTPNTYDLSFSSETTRVNRYDWQTNTVLPEILVHDEEAVDLSPVRDVGSILRNHDFNQIIGAPVSVNIEAREGVGRARIKFGTTARAKEAETEVNDKTLRGVSCGYDYRAEDVKRLKAGEIFTTKSGRTITGPALVVTRWSVHEISLTPCPADPSVGLGRSSQGVGTMGIKEYIESLCRTRSLPASVAAAIVARGLKTFAEAEAAVMAVVRRTGKPKKRRAVGAAFDMGDGTSIRAEEGDEDEDDEDEDDEDEGARGRRPVQRPTALEVQAAERGRISEITAVFANARLSGAEHDVQRQKFIDDGASVDQVRAHVLTVVTGNSNGTSIAGGSRGGTVNVVADGGEKKFRFHLTNLGRRSWADAHQQISTASSARTEADKTAFEASGFETEETKQISRAHTSIANTCRAWMEMLGMREANGVPLEYAAPSDIAMQYFNQRTHLRAAAANTSADLANALSALQHKSLMKAFEAAKQSWRSWARVGSLTDFKQAPAIQVSDFAQLKELKENEEISDSKLSDRAEVRQLDVYARKIGLDIRMFINDDVSALSRLPAMMGKAARQLPSRLVYTSLLANGAMSDGNNLFDNTNHFNSLSGGGSALAASGLAAAIAAFRNMRTYPAPNDPEFATENTEIEPGVLLVPPGLEYTANQLADPNMFVTDYGYFKGKFKIEVEPRLANTSYTGYSAIAWYLMAYASDADNMEVSFLNGSEAPVTGSFEDFHALTQWFRCWLACGVKPLDWRGMIKNAGS